MKFCIASASRAMCASLSVSALLCSFVAGASPGLERLWSRSRTRRDANSQSDDSIYSQTNSQLAGTLHDTLFNRIIDGNSRTDIIFLLDSSRYMGEERYNTGRHFLARIVQALPRRLFLNGSIRTSMITYSTIGEACVDLNFSYSNGNFKEMVRRAVKNSTYQGGIENHGSQAVLWADYLFTKSSRYSSPNTKKVIIYATSGHVTDKDALRKLLTPAVTDAWAHTATELHEKDITILMLAIGNSSDLNKANIRQMASSPASSYVIPVADNSQVDQLITDVRSRSRS